MIPLINAYVEGSTLVVKDAQRFKSNSAAVVITVKQISNIATTDDVAVTADRVSGPALSLSMGGSSAVTLKAIAVGKLHAALGGKSAFKVSGVVDDFLAEVGGSASLRATELAARSVSVKGGGSAQAIVWATDALSISLSGSAGISYFGTASPTVATSGSATVKRLGAAPQSRQ